MPGGSVQELNKKVTLSVGAIILILSAAVSVTQVYTSITTLESRMDKRYAREQDQLKHLEEDVETEIKRIWKELDDLEERTPCK